MGNWTKWSGVVAAALLAGGCSLTIDPESVKPPVPPAVCTVPQVNCSGTCRNLQTDIANCGTCGNTCGTGATCGSGVCACSAPQSLCGTSCVNFQTDPVHCGSCAVACAAGQACVSGGCSSAHRIAGGGVQLGSGNASAAGGHSVQAGTIGTSATGAQGAAGGHSISHGNVSQ